MPANLPGSININSAGTGQAVEHYAKKRKQKAGFGKKGTKAVCAVQLYRV